MTQGVTGAPAARVVLLRKSSMTMKEVGKKRGTARPGHHTPGGGDPDAESAGLLGSGGTSRPSCAGLLLRHRGDGRTGMGMEMGTYSRACEMRPSTMVQETPRLLVTTTGCSDTAAAACGNGGGPGGPAETWSAQLWEGGSSKA